MAMDYQLVGIKKGERWTSLYIFTSGAKLSGGYTLVSKHRSYEAAARARAALEGKR